MLIDFTVENFKSIKEEQTVSMLASISKNEHPDNIFQPGKEENITLLKTAVVYGANASGKSNLISAIQTLAIFVVKSTDLKLGEYIPVYIPYKLDKNYREKPSKFEIEFIGNDKIRYRYTVKFNQEEVLFEELVFYPNKQEARFFLREKGKSIKFGHHVKGRKKNIESELIPNNLFLSKAANSNHEQLKEVYLYFLRNLTFHPVTDLRKKIVYSKSLEIQKEGSDHLKDKLSNFLAAADTGIHSIGLGQQKMNGNFKKIFPGSMPEGIRNEILPGISPRPGTCHRLYEGEKEIGTIPFDLDEESNGTLKMYALAGEIISGLERGETIMVDELDSSLHPHLSEYILELFNYPGTNPNNAQIIAATHDATLLNPKNLRRDQIWFTRKNTFGATEVFSLDEFDKNEVRKNTPFDKWYLEGRFGAIPLINKKLFRIDENG
jgi:AAA15 family ATPase/GTPase